MGSARRQELRAVLAYPMGAVAAALVVTLVLVFAAWRWFVWFSGPHHDWRDRAAEWQIGLFHEALDAYRADHGEFPPDLWSLARPGPGGDAYIDRIPLDPWERPYIYVLVDAEYPWVLTLGEDGLAGGEGMDADISSASFRERWPDGIPDRNGGSGSAPPGG